MHGWIIFIKYYFILYQTILFCKFFNTQNYNLKSKYYKIYLSYRYCQDSVINKKTSLMLTLVLWRSVWRGFLDLITSRCVIEPPQSLSPSLSDYGKLPTATPYRQLVTAQMMKNISTCSPFRVRNQSEYLRRLGID